MRSDLNKNNFLDRIPTFSLVLILIVLMVVGAATIPLLKIAYMPSKQSNNNVYVYINWKDASATAIEQEITSKVEGAVSSIQGVESSSSTSSNGRAYVTGVLKDNANLTAVRFELSSKLKYISDALPEGATVRVNNVGGGGEDKKSTKMVLSYNINANFDKKKIKEYVEANITPFISQVDYVTNVRVSGSAPLCLYIKYNPYDLLGSGISPDIISSGLKSYLGQNSIIGDIERVTESGDRERISLLLRTEDMKLDMNNIPLGEVDGRMIYLNDIATFSLREKQMNYYYRVNGKNMVAMSIEIDAEESIINASSELRAKMAEIESKLSRDFTITLERDEAKEVRKEIYKLISRTSLSLLILLLFVWIVSRSLKYLSIIGVSLLANVLIAFIFFYLFDIELNLVSLAGIAVSFGIVIDTTIVMVDHYSYYRNRTVFIAILAALLTTIGSLIIVYGLPDYLRQSLSGFAAIIIINLTVALFISLFFVPALIDRCGLTTMDIRRGRKHYQNVSRWSNFYAKYINYTQRRKWIYIIILILLFGLPVDKLPNKLGYNSQTFYALRAQGKTLKDIEFKWYEKAYNSVFGSTFYREVLKEPVEIMLGGTMRLFSKGISSRSYNMGSKETKLNIYATPNEGTDDIEEFNQKMWELDNYLATFDEIQRFATRVGEDNASIVIEFEEEHNNGSFPKELEQKLKDKTAKITGVDWYITGPGSRSNYPRAGVANSAAKYKAQRIGILGYDYSKLLDVAEDVAERISKRDLVKNVTIEGGHNWNNNNRNGELYINYDMEKVALYDLNLSQGYSAISKLMQGGSIGNYRDEEDSFSIEYESTESGNITAWELMNSYYDFGGKQMKYSLIADVGVRPIGGTINKTKQEYSLEVTFNYEGDVQRADSIINSITEEVNALLPIGFRTGNKSYGWYRDTGEQYTLLILIVVIIFFVCAILFESLLQPFIIILMIPVSFIGAFIAYPITGVQFGQGGFAALVLLCGLVVNAAIYIINEYNNLNKRQLIRSGVEPIIATHKYHSVRQHIKAYNHKCVAVMLTIISTVLGLVPFLLDGAEGDEFWFSFAVGTIGGLLFSVIALVFIMPIFMPFAYKRRKNT